MFFLEDIPKDLFSTKKLFKYLNDEFIKNLELRLTSSNVKSTPCFLFSIYKGETERRILRVSHTSTYLCLSKFILKNINLIYGKYS